MGIIHAETEGEQGFLGELARGNAREPYESRDAIIAFAMWRTASDSTVVLQVNSKLP